MSRHTSCALVFVLLSYAFSMAQKSTCDSIKLIHYSNAFFSRSGIDVKKYSWNQPEVNCHINKAERFNRAEKSLTGVTAFMMGAGIGLVATGFGIGHPKNEATKQLQTILALSGVASLSISVPFAVLQRHYQRKAIGNARKAGSLLIH